MVGVCVNRLKFDYICNTENGGKPRRKATTPGTSGPKSAVGGGRRVSAPPQFPNAGTLYIYCTLDFVLIINKLFKQPYTIFGII